MSDWGGPNRPGPPRPGERRPRPLGRPRRSRLVWIAIGIVAAAVFGLAMTWLILGAPLDIPEGHGPQDEGVGTSPPTEGSSDWGGPREPVE